MFEHPTGNKPKKIVILGTGPSRIDYLNILASDKPDLLEVDEVWGVNTATNFARVDLTFVMDDYAAMKGHVPATQHVYENAKEPIITSVARKEIPNAVSFPLGEILLMNPNRDFFNHTVAYMAAYAAWLGVEEILVFGTDYISAAQPYSSGSRGADLPPRYMACMSYWLGFCEGRGIRVIITPNSPLLDADYKEYERLYGYLIKPKIRRVGDPQTE